MWWIINLLLALVGVCSFLYGQHIDKDENWSALFIAIAGIIILAIAAFSSFVHLLW